MRAQVLSQPPSRFTELGGHVAIAASLPSRRSSVRKTRDVILGLLKRAGTIPLYDFGAKDCVPCVCHMISGPARFRPDAIFVGEPAGSCDVSPWSMPLPMEPFSVNASFLRARADIRALLWPLRNKTVQCNCNNTYDECWAALLVDSFIRLFIPCPNGHYQYNTYRGLNTMYNQYGEYDDDEDDDDGNEIYDDVGTKQQFLPRQSDLAAGGRQGARHRPAQLVPDGLSPEAHLCSALETEHPFVGKMVSTFAVNQALDLRVFSAAELNQWRAEVMEAVKQLAAETAAEDEELLDLVPFLVSRVLRAYAVKKIGMMREIWFVAQPRDYAAVACLCVGLPMLGWAPPAFGLMPRLKAPSNSYADWKLECSSRNSKIIGRIQKSSDFLLDSLAFNKTIDETKAGGLLGPFYSINDIPSANPGVAPRCGIWERHGEAVEADVRNIDDLLAGEQNTTAGSVFSHRPTDADALVAQCRAVARKCPKSKLKGWSSDYSKEYKQVPGDPNQVMDIVLVQYDPLKDAVAFFIALSLVFGSKTAPVNFARYPAAFCEIVATLFLLPATHDVDDVIFIEEAEVVDSGKACWDLLMELCGWLMSTSKNAPPSSCFAVIGISLDLGPFPADEPTVLITASRIASLSEIMHCILWIGALGSGEAASLAGKLGFALSVTFGKFGRCRIRPILRRSYSRARKVNAEIRACLLWWLSFLRGFTSRPIPTSLESLPLVVSYSDGEGGWAGIGAAIWLPNRERPLAVYAEVPPVLREHWRSINGSDGFEDIFLVEALGPLLLLVTFPQLLRECLLLHFIDNSAAEASLVRGSSSSRLGDHVVGLTWSHIQRRRIWAYFDRVESKANPVDGLSRRIFKGPWERLYQRTFPLEELLCFARSFEDGTL